MSEGTMETPVEQVAPTPEVKPAQQKPSAAQDVRNIQMLLVSGIYPGNVAPQVVAAYTYLEKLAQKIEEDAKATEDHNAAIEAKRQAELESRKEK